MIGETPHEIDSVAFGQYAVTRSAGAVKLRAPSFVAIAAMVTIAQGGNKPVPLREVAAAVGVSVSYLEQLLRGLRNSGLAASFRGPRGGYRLSKPATGISVLDIVVSVEGAAIARRKKQGGRPPTRQPLAQYLRDQMEAFQYLLLQHMSLADVASASLNRNPFLRRIFKKLRRRSRLETSLISHPPARAVAGTAASA